MEGLELKVEKKVDEESIEILKFHNCKGIVEIPERIGSDGWIRGLASGALVLSSSTSLVKIPSTLDKFEADSITFKNDDKSYGYPSIVVPLRSKAEKYFSSDSYWHARSYYWGHVLTEVFIPSSVIETLSNPQQSWGESCTQVAITKATEKNSVVYYVRV